MKRGELPVSFRQINEAMDDEDAAVFHASKVYYL
jgi:hypothetical protein